MQYYKYPEVSYEGLKRGSGFLLLEFQNKIGSGEKPIKDSFLWNSKLW